MVELGIMMKNIKKLLLVSLLLCFYQNIFASDLNVKENQNLKTILSAEVGEAVLKNKFTFINFWATWCIPCIQEIPALEKFASEYSKKSIGVILVNANEEKMLVEKFLKKKSFKLPHYYDIDKKMIDALGFSTLPYTFVVDDQLKLVKILRGNHSYSDFVSAAGKL